MKWYQKSFRRCLVDMHIPDWDESYFFSKLDPEEYVAKMKETGVDAAYVYANSCVGLCNWPTKVGRQHAGLGGRDVLGEILNGLRREGITPIVYINIWSKWAYENHPEWRCIDQKGRGTLDYIWDQPGRYGECCMNSSYADYVLQLVDELCENYEFEGFWVDMILWRMMCYCPECRKRFLAETGHELPAKVDWSDPVWNLWLRKREEWNAEFFQRIVDRVHSYKPATTVMCNSSYYPTCFMGESLKFFRIGEFIGGDYDMDRLHHSFECKFFNSVSLHKPFEFLGSVMDPALNEHSIIKSEDKLETLLFSTLSNNGRYGFIDAIDPSGTLNPRVYQRMRKIFELEKPYEPYLRPEVRFVQDVGLYTNLESYLNPSSNGQQVVDANLSSPHQDGTVEAARTLMESHIPFGVLTPYDLERLSEHRILALSDLMVVSEEEAAALEKFVERGGCLYISGRTGMYNLQGQLQLPGRLSGLLGVQLEGVSDDQRTYIRPAAGQETLLCDYTDTHPLSVETAQTLAVPCEGTQVMGYLTLPLVPTKDTTKFASAISDPPGRHTQYASLTLRRFGKGLVLYSASKLETQHKPDQRQTFLNLLSLLKSRPWSFETDAPHSVELTLYEQPEDRRYLLNLLNIQAELPNIPVHDLSVRVEVPQAIRSVRLLPQEEPLAFVPDGDGIRFIISRLNTYQMVALEY